MVSNVVPRIVATPLIVGFSLFFASSCVQRSSFETWQAACDAGKQAATKGDYKSAESFYEKAISEAEAAHDDKQRLTSLGALADVYYRDHLFEESQKAYLVILQEQERVYGKESPTLIPALNNVIRVSCVGGKCAASLPYLEQLLKIRTSAFGPTHPDVLLTLGLIGETYEKEGNYDQALAYFEKRAKVADQSLGTEDASAIAFKLNVARICLKKGDYTRACSLYQQALANEEKLALVKDPLVEATVSGYKEALTKSGHKALAASVVYKPGKSPTK